MKPVLINSFFIQAELKIDAKFTPSLNDPTSEAFKQLANILEEEVMAVLKPSIPYVAAVQVLSFKPGSIIAVFRIITDNDAPENAVDASMIISALTEGIKSGILDSIKVDPTHPIIAGG